MIKSTSKIKQILPPDLLVTAVVVGQTMNIPYNPMMNIPWPMLSYTKLPSFFKPQMHDTWATKKPCLISIILVV